MAHCSLLLDIQDRLTSGSESFSSADDVKQDHHDGNHQQNVNKATHGIGGDKTQEPQDDQNNSESV